LHRRALRDLRRAQIAAVALALRARDGFDPATSAWRDVDALVKHFCGAAAPYAGAARAVARQPAGFQAALAETV
jgi:hypothetical protein